MLYCEISFFVLKGNDSIAHILRTNKKAIEFNSMLGYEVFIDDPSSISLLYKMTNKSFKINTLKLRDTACKLSGNDPKLYLFLEKQDYDSGIAQFLESIINDSNLKFDTCFNNDEKIYSFIFD